MRSVQDVIPKCVPQLDLNRADYYCHHKNHIGKEMYICATVFVLNQNNDITKGGIAVPIAMIHVGKMVQATKDSYESVQARWYLPLPKN